MQLRSLAFRLAVWVALAVTTACDRSLLHDLPDPLPANDLGASTCAGKAPSDLVVVAHEDRVELSWRDNAAGALTFVVERQTTARFEDMAEGLTTASYTDRFEISPDTRYNYRVRGEGDGCRTSATPSVEVLTFPRPPAALVARGSHNSILLEWRDTNENESGYRVDLLEDTGRVTLATLGPNTTSWTEQGVALDSHRRYAVVAVNASGEAEVTVNASSAPRAPADLVATVHADNRVSLTWTDENQNESGYRVFRAEGESGSEMQLAELPANATFFDDNSVMDSTRYTYAVVAFSESAESPRATATVTTPCPDGNPLQAVSINARLSSTWDASVVEAQVLWHEGAPEDEVVLYLERREPDEVAFTPGATSLWPPVLMDALAVPDTRYRYRVRVERRSCTWLSDEVELVTAIPPIPPAALRLSSSSATELLVEWDDAFTHETGFGVYVFPSDENGSFPRHTSSPGADATSLLVEGLAPGRLYTVVVVPEVPSSAHLPMPPAEVLESIAATHRLRPAAPSEVSVSALDGSRVSFSVLQIPAGASAVRIDQVGGDTVLSVTSTGTYIEGGLSPGTLYEYDAYAVNGGGDSAPVRLSVNTFAAPLLSWTGFSPWLTAAPGTCRFTSNGVTERDERAAAMGLGEYTVEVLHDPLNGLSLATNESSVSVLLQNPDKYLREPFSFRWSCTDVAGTGSIDRTIVIDFEEPAYFYPPDAPYAVGNGQQVTYAGPAFSACDEEACYGTPASIGVGRKHSCVVDAAKRLWCWGANDAGMLGDGTEISRANPTQVCVGSGCNQPFEDVSAVAVGRTFTCAISDAELYCWGDPTLGVTGPVSTPRLQPETSVAIGVTNVSAGSVFACYVANQNVFCFGRNDEEALGGNVSGPISTVPVRVCPNRAEDCSVHYTSVSAGGWHACAVTTVGTLHCWGANGRGQLGTNSGSGSHASAPVVCGEVPLGPTCNVNELRGVRQAAAGREHTCALLDDGQVVCWGSNDDGLLGLPSATAQRSTPAYVCMDDSCAEHLDRVILVAAEDGTCAVRDDYTVWCWGPLFGRYPQVLCESGFASACDENDPALEAVAVEMGERHLCLVEPSGGVRCVGDGSEGRLGDGTFEAPTEPLPPPRVEAVCASGAEEACVPFESAALSTCGVLAPFEVSP